MIARLDVFGLATCSLAVAVNVVAFALNVPMIPEQPIVHSLLATVQATAAVFMVVLARGHWLRIAAARAADRMGVRVLRDGAELPCRLVRLGADPRGVTVWAVVAPPHRDGDRLCAEVLPPMTALWWAGMDP